MIASFRFEWGWIREATPEQLARVRAILPELPADDQKAREDWTHVYVGDLRKLLQAGAKLELGGMSGEQQLHSILALDQKLDELADKIGRLQPVREEHHHAFNAKCSVHVPGLGLMLVDEVEVKENFCTDELQSFLDDGWRILAICPQPDQRRPDYVLGRAKSVAANTLPVRPF